MNMDMSHAQRTFTLVCYALVLAIVGVLFVENFVFSSSFAYLGFREVDDVAFQTTIRNVHLKVLGGTIGKLFNINDYAYGWVYWVTISVVTFPLFLLSHFLGVDWPLIVAPRQISLLFAVLSMLVLRKILKSFSAPEWLAAGAVLMFALLPTTGYFSMRFGTVNAVMFFSMLAVYFAMRDRELDKPELIRISMTLAVSGAIKLTGLLVAPVVFYFVLKRLKGRRLDSELRSLLVKGAIVFAVALVLLTAPQLPYLVFRPERLARFFDNLAHFIEVTRIPSGPTDPFERFYVGALGSLQMATVYAALGLGLLVGALSEKARRLDFLAVIVVLLLISLYVMTSVKNALSIGSYLTGISFLLFLGLQPLRKLPGAMLVMAVLIGLLFLDVLDRGEKAYETSGTKWSHVSYFAKQSASADNIRQAERVLQCIQNEKPLDSVRHIFMDYMAPSLINPLNLPDACLSLAWDNLAPEGAYCDRPVEFLVLDGRAVGNLPPDDFNARLQSTNAATAAGYQRDRASREALRSTGRFGAQTFHKVCESGSLQVYAADP